ncbi:hypothetical protein ACFSKU_11215 [Pontibacter silvestris]|uniref:Uncharacterized protein n=1 Tax=Pontibacter silvestris TaxID=2305183 RepID=A0ABW4WYF2_9BACT|nr:hypothetical protein [Pontibacter silvestris]MCC9135413.1 hypothetical protein [Pontibacter silvestris]
MAALKADNINSEFLKTFLPETVYLLPEDNFTSEETAAVPEHFHGGISDQQTGSPEQLAASVSEKPSELPKKNATETKRFNVIGENLKGVVVLVTLPEHEFQNLPKLEFLQKILHAIGLQRQDVAYVNNLTGKTAQFEELKQLLPINYIISFASRVDTDLPHDKFTLYNPVAIAQVPVVFSQSLAILEHDTEHKKMLWGALKKVFL